MGTTPPQTFHPFPCLPFEIRQIIWGLCKPQPRRLVIELCDSTAPEDRRGNLLLPPTFTPKLRQQNYPTLLAVCHESRALILESYDLVHLGPNVSFAFNTYKDTIHIRGPKTTGQFALGWPGVVGMHMPQTVAAIYPHPASGNEAWANFPTWTEIIDERYRLRQLRVMEDEIYVFDITENPNFGDIEELIIVPAFFWNWNWDERSQRPEVPEVVEILKPGVEIQDPICSKPQELNNFMRRMERSCTAKGIAMPVVKVVQKTTFCVEDDPFCVKHFDHPH